MQKDQTIQVHSLQKNIWDKQVQKHTNRKRNGSTEDFVHFVEMMRPNTRVESSRALCPLHWLTTDFVQ